MPLWLLASSPLWITWVSLLLCASCVSNVHVNHDGQFSVVRREGGKHASHTATALGDNVEQLGVGVIAKDNILEKMKQEYETNALKLRGPWPAYFNSNQFKDFCNDWFDKSDPHRTGFVDVRMHPVALLDMQGVETDPLLDELLDGRHSTQVDKGDFVDVMKYVNSRRAWLSLPATEAAVEMWRQRIIAGTMLTVLLSFTLFIIGLRTDSTQTKQSLADSVVSEYLGLRWLPNKRTIGFALLWLLLALAAAGFAPAGVLKLLGHPWYFDGARQIGANAFQGLSTFHGLAGTAWLAVLLHQTVTAYRLGQSAEIRQSSHALVGRIGALVALLASVSGVYLLVGSMVSRLPEYLTVSLCGIYVAGNVFFGILHVRNGNILAHKQNMAWAIAFTAWPGIMRFANYGWYLFEGQTCPTQCSNQLASQAPSFCSIVSFAVSTDCGIGYVVPKTSWLSSWAFGFVLWLLWGRGHVEILVGNSLGFMLAPFADNVLKNVASSVVVGSASRLCKVCL